MSAGSRVPANTESTKSAHFKALAGSGTAVVGGAVAAAAVFTIGAAAHNVSVMAGGPAVVVLAVLAIAYYMADSQAEDEFFNRFADAHGLIHASKYSLLELTPLLGGGDRRHCEHWMMAGTRGVGWFTFEVRHDNGDKADTWEPHEFTIATDDLGELDMARFRGIYLRRRRGVFEKLDSDSNWLRHSRLEKVELESTAFVERYELWRERDQDEIVVRQLFAPTFVLWLAEHPLQPGFEVRAGTLVVFIPGQCSDAGNLEFLLMAQAEIAKRIRAELTDAARAGLR